jgi:fibronectin type 3 domain-containing protein
VKKQIQILLLIILTVTFSACSSKKYAIRDFSLPEIPSFNTKKLDRSLPTVKGLKSRTSLSQAALEWVPVTDKRIAGYRIFRTQTGARNFRLIATISDRYKSHYIDRNLAPGIQYVYRISVYTDDGRVSQTSSTQVARIRTRLSPPILIETSQDLPKRIKLIWKMHKDPTIKSYLVERKDSNRAGWTSIANLSNRLNVEYIDKDIIDGKKYFYRIRSKSYEGVVSKPSMALEGKSKKLPLTIKSLRATDNRAKEIQLIWSDENNPKDVSHYNIYSSTLENTLFTLLGRTKSNEKKYIDRFEVDGITRYYKVTVVDFDGLESPQTDKSVLGKTVAPARAPIITSATVKQNSIFLKWSDPDGRARKYTIVKKFWDGWRSEKRMITDYKSTRFSDSKVKVDTRYTYYIISLDKHGIESFPSKEVVLSIQPH